ncbi:MAG: GAF domain-containing protein [Pseudomonadales bacterium]|uniref:GAF domain-containing protein n=1 Tax=Alcanivorax sp. MD8A TaxID=1177157 RepID=UPI000C9CAD51|nr:GAF domain-containing protein [Alcanivorax sp. MD8A]MCG8438857.1 GAF domain-containing protein [Pseudomonadales bacterium]MEE2870565.1 GAF domain-containing protein [Pseudomonadota bacterium]PNE02161.1 sensor histidine kinase/response regulator [Alcanivorax sp. MD8A]
MATDTSDALTEQQVNTLRQALNTTMVRFDPAREKHYLAYAYRRARLLIHQSVYLLTGIYLLVVVPVMILMRSEEMALWRNFGVYPIALALLALWASTRISWLKLQAVAVMYLALGLSISGTLLGAIYLDGHFAGQIAAFETIYLLIIGFSILRLPPRQTLTTCLVALAVSLIGALLLQVALPLLAMMLYFVIPLIICTVNGYILDVGARRNFANHLLLDNESNQLRLWREQVERDTFRQQQLNHFMEKIAGNLTPAELLQKVLGYLVDQIGAKAGAAYVLEDGNLIQHARWGLNAQAASRQQLKTDESLLGAALQQKIPLQQHAVPEGYLDLEVGEGKRQPGAVLLWPLHQGEQPLGIVEVAGSQSFEETDLALLNELHRPLAFALQSAQRREAFLQRMQEQQSKSG